MIQKDKNKFDFTTRIYDFAAVLKDAGIKISTSELLTLFESLPHISLADKDIFRQTLQTTLVKDYTDIPVFNKCFNDFFRAWEVNLKRQNLPVEIPGNTANEILNLEKSISEFIDALSDEIPEISDYKEIVKLFINSRSGNPAAGGISAGNMILNRMDISLFTDTKTGLAGPAESNIENEELITNIIKRKITSRLTGKNIRRREELLLGKYIYQLTPDEIEEMRQLIKRFGQKLKNRISLRKKKVKHGGIDVKRTLRKNLNFGGIPFKIYYKDRKQDRPQLAVLCDISGSVNQYTRFMLLLTYTLQNLFSKVRTFAFISNIIEITGLFMEMNPERAINSIFSDTDFTYGWGSNYGKCFDDFIHNHSNALNKKTTVLILGDARNNNQDPGLDSFIKISEKCRNIIWLNPEKKHLWDWNDSIASVYRPHCKEMKEVNNFIELSEFVDRLFI